MSRRYGRALVIGVAAGLFASYAMERGQVRLAKLIGDKPSEREPSTVVAAEKLARAVGAGPIGKQDKKAAGRAVHYATGAALGAVYALAAERWRWTTALFGAAFGAAISAGLDEAAVPALGLAPPPAQVSASGHLQGVAAHLGFGVALESARSLLDSLLP